MEPHILVKDPPKLPYKDSEGNVVPSVTQVLSIISKPDLLNWAWRMGTYRKTLDNVRSDAIDIGHLAHHYIHCFVNGWEPEVDDKYKHAGISKAQAMLELFKQYWASRKAIHIASEFPIVDDELQVGGTLDLVTETDKGLELWDFKTSAAIWPEYYIQVAAYQELYYRYCYIKPTPRIILMTKKGWFDAPDIAPSILEQAGYTWGYILSAYPHLMKLRELANGGARVEEEPASTGA